MPTMRGKAVHAGAMTLWLGVLPSCLGEPPDVGGSAGSSSTAAGTASGPGDPDTTGSLPQSPACAEYLECVAQADPPQLPAAQARYDPEGTCWIDATTAAQCDATCIVEAQALCPEGTGNGTGEESPLTCSIEGLQPGAASPVEVGDGAEQLPPEIGAVLERNCGCHYVDPRQLDPEVPAYFGAIRLHSWPQFHTPFMGQPTWQRVQQRAVVELGMPPPYFCDDLELGALSAEDYALLGAWLEAGAPDAIEWGA